ncbi:MAG: hypothetical protein PHU85_08610 [Phycisphaerae bacterium]|nr:hypothetical protein [Phycisphaerae bacterium]
MAIALGIALAATVASAADVAFSVKPTVTRDGDKTTISFAVSRACDVAICVEDAKGRVVRHLVAGVLGRSAPAPLKADSLSQAAPWDGKNDLGKPADGGPFKIRVSLGLSPTLESLIGYKPETLGGLRALAVGPDGNVYAFHCYGSSHPHDGSTVCAVFDRAGKYVKTILPYPAGTPEEKLKGLRRVDVGNGTKVPFIYQFETRSTIPGLGDLPSQRPVVARDGRLAFVGIQEGPQPFAQAGEARLTVVYTDGSVPADGVLKTLIHPVTDSAASLALSPDEKTLYATGVRASRHPAIRPGGPTTCQDCTHGGHTWDHSAPTRRVYRFGWDDAGAGEFAKDVAFKEPVSVATDKDGNVYVADLADGRIVALRPDGSMGGSFKVARPHRVEVNRKTGDLYVLSGDQKIDVIKFSPNGTELARLTTPMGYKDGFYPIRRPIMAVDDSVDPAVLWIGGPLYRVEDRGKSFSEPVRVVPDTPTRELTAPESIYSVMDMSVDRVHGWLYVNNYWRYDTTTGRWEKAGVLGNAMWPGSGPGSANATAGLDGNYYVHGYLPNKASRYGTSIYVSRLGPDLKPMPFSAATENNGRLRGFALDFGYGHTADAAGNVYVLWKKCPTDPGDLERAHALYMYGPDGQLTKPKLVNSDIPFVRSVRVDYAGNIYLHVGVRPGKSTLPPGLQGQLREGREDPDAVNRVNPYPLIYGSVVKFGPEGGVIRKGAGGVPCNYSYGEVTEIKDARWIFPGASNVVSWGAGGTVAACRCELSGLDVDGFGRSFFCDAGRFRVGAIDTAGNEVCWIGSYGNQDSAGPAIAFAWPQALAVDDKSVYVGDRLNRRIVRVKLGYAAVETMAVP